MKRKKPVRKKKRASILNQIVQAKMPEVEALQDEYDLVDYIQSALDIEDSPLAAMVESGDLKPEPASD